MAAPRATGGARRVYSGAAAAGRAPQRLHRARVLHLPEHVGHLVLEQRAAPGKRGAQRVHRAAPARVAQAEQRAVALKHGRGLVQQRRAHGRHGRARRRGRRRVHRRVRCRAVRGLRILGTLEALRRQAPALHCGELPQMGRRAPAAHAEARTHAPAHLPSSARPRLSLSMGRTAAPPPSRAASTRCCTRCSASWHVCATTRQASAAPAASAATHSGVPIAPSASPASWRTLHTRRTLLRAAILLQLQSALPRSPRAKQREVPRARHDAHALPTRLRRPAACAAPGP